MAHGLGVTPIEEQNPLVAGLKTGATWTFTTWLFFNVSNRRTLAVAGIFGFLAGAILISTLQFADSGGKRPIV